MNDNPKAFLVELKVLLDKYNAELCCFDSLDRTSYEFCLFFSDGSNDGRGSFVELYDLAEGLNQ